MKLFMWPGSCAIGIRVLLEEIGRPYQAVPVNLVAKQQYSPDFLAINPKAKVPALLRDDGSLLTEFGAIAWWLARSFPDAGLMPDGAENEARAAELMDYVVATVHMRGFNRVIAPQSYAFSPEDYDAVRERGLEIIRSGFAIIADALQGRTHVLDRYSFADAALFYVEHWTATRVPLALPPACARHYEGMLRRPAVERALAGDALVVA